MISRTSQNGSATTTILIGKSVREERKRASSINRLTYWCSSLRLLLSLSRRSIKVFLKEAFNLDVDKIWSDGEPDLDAVQLEVNMFNLWDALGGDAVVSDALDMSVVTMYSRSSEYFTLSATDVDGNGVNTQFHYWHDQKRLIGSGTMQEQNNVFFEIDFSVHDMAPAPDVNIILGIMSPEIANFVGLPENNPSVQALDYGAGIVASLVSRRHEENLVMGDQYKVVHYDMSVDIYAPADGDKYNPDVITRVLDFTGSGNVTETLNHGDHEVNLNGIFTGSIDGENPNPEQFSAIFKTDHDHDEFSLNIMVRACKSRS